MVLIYFFPHISYFQLWDLLKKIQYWFLKFQLEWVVKCLIFKNKSEKMIGNSFLRERKYLLVPSLIINICVLNSLLIIIYTISITSDYLWKKPIWKLSMMKIISHTKIPPNQNKERKKPETSTWLKLTPTNGLFSKIKDFSNSSKITKNFSSVQVGGKKRKYFCN